MGYVRNRRLSALFALLISVVLTLGVSTAGSAASPQSIKLSWISVHSSTLSESPYTDWRTFTVKLFAWQTNLGTKGVVVINDPVNEIAIVGNINDISAIDYGYQFQGCGKAYGPLYGDVCFTGTGQTLINGVDDAFTLSLTSGGVFSVGGHLPAGSVSSTNTVGPCLSGFIVPNC